MSGQARQQACFHQRRLAAARRTVDQASAERLVRVDFLDSGFPEANALGQAVPSTRTGEQLEKEVCIAGVERT
jgi:hypothetical protein